MKLNIPAVIGADRIDEYKSSTFLALKDIYRMLFFK
jgi:hypothetical protein